MLGLLIRALQCFVRDTYGAEKWVLIAQEAGHEHCNYEPMLSYPPDETRALFRYAARILNASGRELLEDIGSYLVSHQNMSGFRRLLRFGGDNFVEFLFSLNDFEQRASLALPDMSFPAITVSRASSNVFDLHCRWNFEGYEPIVFGAVRAMADDYGALVLVDHLPKTGEDVSIRVSLLDRTFAPGREFSIVGYHV